MRGADEESAFHPHSSSALRIGPKFRIPHPHSASGRSSGFLTRTPHRSESPPPLSSLEEPAFGEGEVPPPSDHHMIGDGNVEQSPRRYQLRRDGAVIRARRRIATGVIVNEDDGGGALRDRFPEHFAWMH